jgi:glycosyltransferase involved in cell wall biosynthesis
MLHRITPLILTFNEAANIGRTLEKLSWARDIVVVDSYSEDETLHIIRGVKQARIFQRKFDSLENQWNFALETTGISSDWVLALDADYMVTPELLEELSSLHPPDTINGYRADFDYCIYGRPLRGSAYPPVTVLYRKDKARYRQDGHAHRVVIEGAVENLKAHMLHDDWKPIQHWLRAQNSYMQLELEKLKDADPSTLALPDRIRKMRYAAPFFVFMYCLIVKKGLWDGRAGIYYAFQRMLAETLLSIYLLDDDLRRSRDITN